MFFQTAKASKSIFLVYFRTAGSDSRLKLWDIDSGCNTLVNYEIRRLQTSKGIQLATSQDSDLVFVPCMTTAKVVVFPFNYFS